MMLESTGGQHYQLTVLHFNHVPLTLEGQSMTLTPRYCKHVYSNNIAKNKLRGATSIRVMTLQTLCRAGPRGRARE